jgi:hypothetical protein
MGAMRVADLDAAARLLVEIAGPAPVHIEMSRAGPKKYYTVKRALTLDDALRHLRGTKTKGALCSRPNGQARALAYDADDPPRWHLLRRAARKLAAAGYHPLLEPSPGGRGGHLWLIYSGLVDAQAARQHAHHIAPELAQITEYWPGPPQVEGWNRVRLPGGRYVAPGDFSAWCRLYNAQGEEVARDGASALRVLLTEQTPADLIPPSAPAADQPGDCDTASAVTERRQARNRDRRPAVTIAPQPQQPAKRNSPLLRNQSARNRFLWFSYTSAQLAAWFNERHTLEELHPCERRHGGMAFSPSVSERTPSTAYHDTERGERWTDFSARARRSDGHPDGGDVLELYVRLRGGSKAAVLSELGREMIAEARSVLEAAARSGAQPPGWVAEIMTPAGWAHYRSIAQPQTRQHR